MPKRLRIPGIVVVILLVGAGGVLVYRQTHPPSPTKSTGAQTSAVKPGISGFNKQQYSLTDPTSIWVVVNKHLPLHPTNYVPSDLVVPTIPLRIPGNQTMEVRQATATALETMFAAASANGTPMMLSSGYRSYTDQTSLYDNYVKTQGQATADAESARPGYSEHQTGFAADLEPLNQTCDIDQCFATTPAGEWLAANAYKYGFIIRYGKGLTSITGYEYEPWHVRYIGVGLATEMHNQNIATLEQFFGLGDAPDYE